MKISELQQADKIVIEMIRDGEAFQYGSEYWMLSYKLKDVAHIVNLHTGAPRTMSLNTTVQHRPKALLLIDGGE